MPWPGDIYQAFTTIPTDNPTETHYSSLHHKILSTLFTNDDGFHVLSQFGIPGSHRSADFAVVYQNHGVILPREAVLIMEVKRADHMDHNSDRERADSQIRKFIQLAAGLSRFLLGFTAFHV